MEELEALSSCTPISPSSNLQHISLLIQCQMQASKCHTEDEYPRLFTKIGTEKYIDLIQLPILAFPWPIIVVFFFYFYFCPFFPPRRSIDRTNQCTQGKG